MFAACYYCATYEHYCNCYFPYIGLKVGSKNYNYFAFCQFAVFLF